MPSRRFPSQQLSASLTLLMLGVLAVIMLIDAGAIFSGYGLLADVAHWSMVVGIATGLVALTVQLVDLVTTPIAIAGRAELGVLGASTTGMVTLFAIVWWLRQHGSGSGWLLILEAAAFAIGLIGAVYARWFLAGSPPPRPVRAFPRGAYARGARAGSLAHRPTVQFPALNYHSGPPSTDGSATYDRHSLR